MLPGLAGIAALPVCLVLLAVFIGLWHWLTPQNYWDEIRNGNPAAAPLQGPPEAFDSLAPLLKPLHAKELSTLLQPDGIAARLLVTCNAVAGRPSSVVNVTETACAPAPTTALIWPIGDAVATTLSSVVAAYATFNDPAMGAPPPSL